MVSKESKIKDVKINNLILMIDEPSCSWMLNQ